MRSTQFRRIGALASVAVLIIAGVALYLRSTDGGASNPRSRRVRAEQVAVGTRKNVTTLSAREKAAFVSAVRSLQTTPAPHHPHAASVLRALGATRCASH